MHPLGIYLAITNSQPEHGRGQASERRPAWARVDAMQIYVRPDTTDEPTLDKP